VRGRECLAILNNPVFSIIGYKQRVLVAYRCDVFTLQVCGQLIMSMCVRVDG